MVPLCSSSPHYQAADIKNWLFCVNFLLSQLFLFLFFFCHITFALLAFHTIQYNMFFLLSYLLCISLLYRIGKFYNCCRRICILLRPQLGFVYCPQPLKVAKRGELTIPGFKPSLGSSCNAFHSAQLFCRIQINREEPWQAAACIWHTFRSVINKNKK